ncbi:MAG: PepSY domain-containing protein [Rubrobacteraceae bacterium]
MNLSRNLVRALLLGLVGAVVGLALLIVFVFPGSQFNASSPDSASSASNDPAGEQAQQNAGNEGMNEEISREQAGEIAVEHLGGGEVTAANREDDHNALWEIEVTRQDGTEADVYVAANGNVNHVNESNAGGNAGSGGEQQPAPEPQQDAGAQEPQGVTAEQAGEIAAAHVGGTVDTIHREEDGDYGAAWDVDVYAPDGEYTIYVSATGEVVYQEGPED